MYIYRYVIYIYYTYIYINKLYTYIDRYVIYIYIYIPSASKTFLFMVVAETPGFFRITRFSRILGFHHVRLPSMEWLRSCPSLIMPNLTHPFSTPFSHYQFRILPYLVTTQKMSFKRPSHGQFHTFLRLSLDVRSTVSSSCWHVALKGFIENPYSIESR